MVNVEQYIFREYTDMYVYQPFDDSRVEVRGQL